MEGSLESYLDRLLIPGRLHDGVHDPEGFLSTIPAIGTALLGMLTGTFLQQNKISMHKKAYGMFAAGVVLVLLGLLWNTVFPINKRLWTSSFVLYVGGLSLILFSIFYFIIDILEWKKWAFPFVIIGTNSIVIYMAVEGMIDFTHTGNFIFGGLIHLTPIIWQPVLSIISVIIIQLAFLYFLYRNKLFLKV
jgi:predicted acyltransferase